MNPALEIADLVVRFGGLVAVAGVSLRAEAGCVTGLIGPNGAGKTTTFDAATGVVVPAEGTVRLGERTLAGMSPTARAQAGLGRTFQRVELWDGMSVRENVALGPELLLAGRSTWRHLCATRTEAAHVEARADDALGRCGIHDLADRPVADLSTGQRRLVELARAMASPFTFLLLDEPSSGLDPAETARFGGVLADFVAGTGIGVLLVEHDMALVRALCSYVYVLDFGALIFDGPTADALSSEVVEQAYLGTEVVRDVAAS